MLQNEMHLLPADFEAAIDSISDGIYIADGTGRTLRVNRAFMEITGIDASAVIGRPVHELVERGIYNRSVTARVLQTRREESMVETLPNGKEVLLTGRPVLASDGSIRLVVTTLRDMGDLNSLRHNLALAMERSERYRMELLSMRLDQMNLDGAVVYSEAMKKVMRTALQLAEVDSTVLITGESGVGKEIVARAIHRAGRGEQAPLISTNCSAIPESLLESELFGYEKGSFTGAERTGKPGLFEVARGGTLFLDEIGDVSMNIQVKLLRAIHEKEVLRVGGRHPVKVDVRVITATNRDLEAMVADGRFRADLYYRLNVIPLHIPPLRERREAILPLTGHFLALFNRRFARQAKFHPHALMAMEAYDWPGNVRELENSVERMVVLCPDELVTLEDLPAHIRQALPADALPPAADSGSGCPEAEPRYPDEDLAAVPEPAGLAGEQIPGSLSADETGREVGSSAIAQSGGGANATKLLEDYPEPAAIPALDAARDEAEKEVLIRALRVYRSTRALAKALKISQSSASRLLRKHGLDAKRLAYENSEQEKI